MESQAIVTVIKMLESLPEPAQNQAVEYLRNYIEELRDEALWDAQFQATQDKLSEVACLVRQQIAEGMSAPLDLEAL